MLQKRAIYSCIIPKFQTGTSLLPYSSKVFESCFILRSFGAGTAQSV